MEVKRLKIILNLDINSVSVRAYKEEAIKQQVTEDKKSIKNEGDDIVTKNMCTWIFYGKDKGVDSEMGKLLEILKTERVPAPESTREPRL